MEHVDLEKVFQKTPSEKEFDKMKLPPRKESDTFLDPFMGIRSDQATLDQFQKRKSSDHGTQSPLARKVVMLNSLPTSFLNNTSMEDLFEDIPRRLSGMSIEEESGPLMDKDKLQQLREKAEAQAQESRQKVGEYLNKGSLDDNNLNDTIQTQIMDNDESLIKKDNVLIPITDQNQDIENQTKNLLSNQPQSDNNSSIETQNINETQSKLESSATKNQKTQIQNLIHAQEDIVEPQKRAIESSNSILQEQHLSQSLHGVHTSLSPSRTLSQYPTSPYELDNTKYTIQNDQEFTKTERLTIDESPFQEHQERRRKTQKETSQKEAAKTQKKTKSKKKKQSESSDDDFDNDDTYGESEVDQNLVSQKPGMTPSLEELTRNTGDSPYLESVGEKVRTVQTAEEKRQTHILSEQKRRAQIKQGFELLKTVLPITSEKKSSKTVMIQTTVYYIRHLQEGRQDLTNQLMQLKRKNAQAKKMKEEIKRKLLYAIGL